jgi:cytidine deaminase
MQVAFQQLNSAAAALVGDFQTPGCITGCEVAAAILSVNGEIFTGVSIDAACGIGFCAEHAAIAEMLKRRQSRIVACVAVCRKGKPMPPCGRCRELMYQLSPENLAAQIQVADSDVRTLAELLPKTWDYTS